MSLEDKRSEAADLEFQESKDLDSVMVTDSAQWETDGLDRLIGRFSYWDEETDNDDERATFCVNFIPDTATVKESYVNW